MLPMLNGTCRCGRVRFGGVCDRRGITRRPESGSAQPLMNSKVVAQRCLPKVDPDLLYAD